MRRGAVVSSLVFGASVLIVGGVAAQTLDGPLTPVQAALLCGPNPEAARPTGDSLRLRGAQDTSPRQMFSQRDLIVIGGGSGAGVQLGQEYFIRRVLQSGRTTVWGSAESVVTVGYLRVVAVNESTAIASIQYACDAILQGDYLAPFVMPAAPASAARDASSGELDFSSMAHVVIARENRINAGAGDLVVMDRGTSEGVAPGARFAVYRDLKVSGMPLAEIGEGVVMTASDAASVVQLTRTRDAVRSGDFLVPRK